MVFLRLSRHRGPNWPNPISVNYSAILCERQAAEKLIFAVSSGREPQTLDQRISTASDLTVLWHSLKTISRMHLMIAAPENAS